MISKKSFKLTSTPFDASHCETTEDADSGYHSNFSGINSSVDSLLAIHSKPRVTFKTPETFGDSGIGAGSDEKNNSRQEEFSNKYFHPRYLQPDLTGREYVDFLYYLGVKNNYSIIVKRILDYLNDSDLYSAAASCRTWKSLIQSIPAEKRRLRNYNRRIEINKENRNVSSNDYDICEEVNVLNSRGTLREIENIRRDSTSSNSPFSVTNSPVGPNNLFDVYQKESRRITLGRRLFSCPICKLPSHVNEIQPHIAKCTNSSCRYRFCILCQCGEHPHKMCDLISTPVARKQSSLVGSRNSKRNLKRLLM